MSENKTIQQTLLLSLDLKYKRIRFHKAALKLLGKPEYIYFLINPETGKIILRPAAYTDRLAIRIYYTENCVEIKSKSLIEELWSFFPLAPACLITMHGKYVEEEQIVVFDMDGATWQGR